MKDIAVTQMFNNMLVTAVKAQAAAGLELRRQKTYNKCRVDQEKKTREGVSTTYRLRHRSLVIASDF